MKLFCVTKETLDLGFGIAPPEWSRVVRAKSKAAVSKVLSRYVGSDFISIKEMDGIGLDEFGAFLMSRPREDGSRQVTDDEVEDMLGRL